MRFIIPVIAALLIITMNSCTSIHTGNISGNAFEDAENYRFTGQASGSVSMRYVLGIGGNHHNAAVHEAKQKLYRSAPLEPNERYVNWTVNEKTSIFPILLFVKKTITVTADIIKILPEDKSISKDSFNTFYKTIRKDSLFKYSYYKYGDSIIYHDTKNDKFIDGQVTDIESIRNKFSSLEHNNYSIQINMNDMTFTKHDINGVNIFSANKKLDLNYDLKVQDSIKLKNQKVFSEKKFINYKLVAGNPYKVIVSRNGNLRKMTYSLFYKLLDTESLK